MIIRSFFLALFAILVHIHHGLCMCYFPGELQGMWATQKTTSTIGSRGARSPISYQEVAIEADRILQWGTCHARADNNVILMDDTGSTRCYRCVYLNVASPKVVQVWTMGLETCYTSEEAAVSTCPSVQAMASKRARELMLYKIRSAWGEPEVAEIECPLNGRFTFTYRRGHNGINTGLCDQPTSEFSNCPYGFGFSVHYRECSFTANLRTGLQCLGSWRGEDNEEYMAVMDTSVTEGDGAPQFKCGMFHEEAGTGRVFIAFSEDSTCTNSLNSPKDGYETYELRSMPPMPLPPSVGQATCQFPRSLLGHWHHTLVADDTVVFKDYRNFKTYSARCVQDMDDGERYIVYARTHCGDWSYNCLWLKRRSANVLEFMLGLYPRETFDERLCDDDKFGDMTNWVTQGKSILEDPTTCPIIGNYMGSLPDANGICAQLYSSCEDPQIMFYTVSECSNLSAIYEQREYQCLGQWEEEGKVYALTYRRDIRTYECFVGVIKNSGIVFIKEAGAVCSRGVQPEILGMKLHKKGDSCPEPSSTSQAISQTSRSPQREENRFRSTQPPWLRTTRPWKPITEDTVVVSCKVGENCLGHYKDRKTSSVTGLMKRLNGKGKFLHKNRNIHEFKSRTAKSKKISKYLRKPRYVGKRMKIWSPGEYVLKRTKRDLPDTINSKSSIQHDDPENDMHESNATYMASTVEEAMEGKESPGFDENHTDRIQGNQLDETGKEMEYHEEKCDSTCSTSGEEGKQNQEGWYTEALYQENTRLLENNHTSSILSEHVNHSHSNEMVKGDAISEHFSRTSDVVTSKYDISVYDDEVHNNSNLFNSDINSQVLHNLASGISGSVISHNTETDSREYLDQHASSSHYLNHDHSHTEDHPFEEHYSHVDNHHEMEDTLQTYLGTTGIYSHMKEHDPTEKPFQDYHHAYTNESTNNYQDNDSHDNDHDYGDSFMDGSSSVLDHPNDSDHNHGDSFGLVDDHIFEDGYAYQSGQAFDMSHAHGEDHLHTETQDSKDDHKGMNMHKDKHFHGKENAFTDHSDTSEHHLNEDNHSNPHRNGADSASKLSRDDILESNKASAFGKTYDEEDIPEDMQIVSFKNENNTAGDMIDYMLKNCRDAFLENMTSENTTNVKFMTNCSEDMMNDDDNATETEMHTTTEDSDIPKIPISLIEYPTAQPTTVKPSMVTLPPMIWQPYAQPGRPRHRGSGSGVVIKSSQPLLFGVLAFYAYQYLV